MAKRVVDILHLRLLKDGGFLIDFTAYIDIVVVAGWSSLVARQAHNLKVAGSNPAPATRSLAARARFRKGSRLVRVQAMSFQRVAWWYGPDRKGMAACQVASAESLGKVAAPAKCDPE